MNLSLYDIKSKNIVNNGLVNFTVSGKNMDLYDLNNNLKVARGIGSIFLHIHKLTMKTYSHLRYINRGYYPKFPIPIMHRQFNKIISQNKKYGENFCYDSNNPFHFSGQKWINEIY